MKLTIASLSVALILSTSGPPSFAADTLPVPNPLKNAYFGDLHLHTSLSFDAFTMNTRTLPEDSYRFARGEEVVYFGQKLKRQAPLDFLAVTDHSEYLGVMRQVDDPNGPYTNSEWKKLLHDTNPDTRLKAILRIAGSFAPGKGIAEFLKEDQVRNNWQYVIDAAEKYYQPGTFTTFVGYEWTAMINMQNLHRNVIFRGPKYTERPFTAIDSRRPEDLWGFLEHTRKNGIEALAISHNANVSNGLMYEYVDSDGKPISREYADSRNRNEPLAEVTQHKGTSETHPGLSPNDEFADFELLKTCWAKPECTLDGSYARQAYARGLEVAARAGANPYKFGLVGATDFHSGISTTDENNYAGGAGDRDTNVKAVLTAKESTFGDLPIFMSASGLTGVWAEANTREAIFDALKRKEVFATSGNRIKVRLFAGWNYPKDLTRKTDWVKTAYESGVPMGSDLPVVASANAPRFVVQAIKDPNAGNLDRVQIVKVWHQAGQSHEKVFDVVWSGKRKPDPQTGKVPAVGNTVDVKTATYKNSIGAIELTTVWEDPEFNAEASATYYARVLEIPTPRWTTYWAVKAKLPLPDRVPATIQERAWTSPIFYKAS